MKRFVNCIALLIWAVFTFKVPVYGQFYTISSCPSYSKVDKGKNHSKTGTVNVKDSQAMAAKDKGSKEKRQERYMALPMKRIKVTSPFGMRKDPFTGKRSMHNGIDLHARGDEVYAMFDGIVKKVGYDKRSGNYVMLQHGDFTVSYCHLSKVMVTTGMTVWAGDAVAITGNTGRSTGEHLHLTIKMNGQAIDPSVLIEHIRELAL